MSPQNYIEGDNPCGLAGPPQWWLRQLWDFDDSLRVVPSRQGFYYRLAQKRKLNLPMHMTNDVMWKDSDTRLLARYGLIPVTTILATANWSNPLMWVELANRAPWRMGGAAKVNAMLEEQDKQERLRKRQATSEHLDYLARDSWNLYRQKQGLRSHMWSPRSAPVTPIDPNPKSKALVLPAMFVR